tara:strand:- start:171 stop:386 length:216 start_codon:yes stop_codon:yes gene_type:complete
MIKTFQKKSNPVAKELRTSKYRQRKTINKMVYNRKDEEVWTPIKGLLKMLDGKNVISDETKSTPKIPLQNT